jgi:hypothetical protein
VVNKPPLLVLMDIDMEVFEKALLKNLDDGADAKLAFIREGRVGLPEVRTDHDHMKEATASVAAPPIIAEEKEVLAVPFVAGCAPIFNFAAGSNVTINMVAPTK